MHGVYSVVRYVPRPERGESINIGLILVSAEDGRVWLQFRKSVAFSNYPPHLRPPKELLQSVKSYVDTLQQRMHGAEPMTFLSGVQHDLENNVQTSEPHPCKFDNPNTFLADMYRMVVSPPSHHISGRR